MDTRCPGVQSWKLKWREGLGTRAMGRPEPVTASSTAPPPGEEDHSVTTSGRVHVWFGFSLHVSALGECV